MTDSLKTSAEILKDALGEYPFGTLRQWPVTQGDYSIVIAFRRPKDKQREGLFLDLENERGMQSTGMVWDTYEGGAVTLGHAWDDNLPDTPRASITFCQWLASSLRGAICDGAATWARGLWPRGSDDVDWSTHDTLLGSLDPDIRNREVLMLRLAAAANLGRTVEVNELLQELSEKIRSSDLDDSPSFAACLRSTEKRIDVDLWRRALTPLIRSRVEGLSDRARPFYKFCQRCVFLGEPALATLAPLCRELCEADDAWIAANAFFEADRFDDAIALLEIADRARPNNHRFRGLLAEAYRKAGRIEDADRTLIPPDPDAAIAEDKELIAHAMARVQYDKQTPENFERLLHAHRAESRIHAHWLSEESMPLAQAISERRLNMEVTDAVARWYRDMKMWQAAVPFARVALSNLDLLHGCFQCRRLSTGHAIGRCLSIFIDSHEDANWREGRDFFVRIRDGLVERGLDLTGEGMADIEHAGACLFSLLGETEPALECVERAVEAGARRDHLRGDPDLNSLREHEAFKRAVEG